MCPCTAMQFLAKSDTAFLPNRKNKRPHPQRRPMPPQTGLLPLRPLHLSPLKSASTIAEDLPTQVRFLMVATSVKTAPAALSGVGGKGQVRRTEACA